MYVMMLTFFAGWFGGHWWRGMEVDAPNPKDPQPWAKKVILGVIAGAAAVVILDVLGPNMANGVAADAERGVSGVAGVLIAIAIGRVAVDIVAPLLNMGNRAG